MLNAASRRLRASAEKVRCRQRHWIRESEEDSLRCSGILTSAQVLSCNAIEIRTGSEIVSVSSVAIFQFVHACPVAACADPDVPCHAGYFEGLWYCNDCWDMWQDAPPEAVPGLRKKFDQNRLSPVLQYPGEPGSTTLNHRIPHPQLQVFLHALTLTHSPECSPQARGLLSFDNGSELR